MSCSTQPLKWAARNPRKTPSVADKMVLMKATSKLMRMDASKRDRTSRPSSSVPSQWLAHPPMKLGGGRLVWRCVSRWGQGGRFPGSRGWAGRSAHEGGGGEPGLQVVLCVGGGGYSAGQQCDAEYGQRPQAAQQHQ